MCSCISPMASFTASWLVGVPLIFDGTTQIIAQRCQIAAPRWPNDISSAADNAIFKNRAQNIECSSDCVARSAVLLKPNVANILLFNFCEQKFVQHGPIAIAIDCNGLPLLIFEEKWPNYASRPKSEPNSDSFWVRRLFNVCVTVFCAQNAIILLVYIPAKIKMSFIWKDDFSLPKSTYSVSWSVAIFPSVVQAYTQPYSYGGRIQLIICQIRHELSVSIHEISTSWKKTLGGGPYIYIERLLIITNLKSGLWPSSSTVMINCY